MLRTDSTCSTDSWGVADPLHVPKGEPGRSARSFGNQLAIVGDVSAPLRARRPGRVLSAHGTWRSPWDEGDGELELNLALGCKRTEFCPVPAAEASLAEEEEHEVERIIQQRVNNAHMKSLVDNSECDGKAATTPVTLVST